MSDRSSNSAEHTTDVMRFSSDVIVATAYDGGLQRIFGNISAVEVAVSLTRNAEIEKRNRIKCNKGDNMVNDDDINLSEEDTKCNDLLRSLPVFDFSKSCSRVIQSLQRSAEKEEEFLFLLRIKSVVDENGFSLLGWEKALTLEGILEVPSDLDDEGTPPPYCDSFASSASVS